jgi:hypothetical protein
MKMGRIGAEGSMVYLREFVVKNHQGILTLCGRLLAAGVVLMGSYDWNKISKEGKYGE